jgi:glycosyltransferase involved in cell wall biosynthesis
VNVLMVTNTYLPQVGGVARSVASFTEEMRRQGHRVVVVAPTYAQLPDTEADVYRVPAIANFNGSDFSLRLPVPVVLSSSFPDFEPDVVHAHHPFLLGDTALRVASVRKVPLVFTHHTMYEQYTHYLPATSEAVRNFAAHLPTGYANLCDQVIAPSESVAAVLRERGVEAPITPIPTGIDPMLFARGDGAGAREKYGIPKGAFVVGHVGRLALEKNLGFLARAVASFVRGRPDTHFLVVGGGPAEADVRAAFAEAGAAERLHFTGPLQDQALADAYHGMDVFAFASKTETQGMVLAEAMTAGAPVVALDAPGARDVVIDGENGRLLKDEAEAAFAAALAKLADAPERRKQFAEGARASAAEYALERCAGRLLDVYARLVGANLRRREEGHGAWGKVLRLLEAEWGIWSARFDAAFKAINEAW